MSASPGRFALALVGLFVAAPATAHAQDAGATSTIQPDLQRQQAGAPNAHPLSAAVQRMQRSPFQFGSEASPLFAPWDRHGFGSSLAHSQSPAPDSNQGLGEVVVPTLASVVVSDFVALYLMFSAANEQITDGLPLWRIAAAPPVAVLGSAVGPTLAGASSYGRAAAGSLLGLGTGLVVAALTDQAIVVIPLHAVILTLVASRG